MKHCGKSVPFDNTLVEPPELELSFYNVVSVSFLIDKSVTVSCIFENIVSG